MNNEFNYYIFLFEKTKEIGIGTSNAFSNLYLKTLKKNFKFYYDLIKEDILFYNDLFYRKNKYIFKENYIKFFADELNDYRINIHGINEYIIELISDINFNNSLNFISKELIQTLLIRRINDTFINGFNNQINRINSYIDLLDKNILQILSKIKINEDNLNINKIIMNYHEILSNQNNKFNFKVRNILLIYF